jgi:hypothetical protein
MDKTVGPVSTCGRELLREWRRPIGLMGSFMIFTASVRKILDQPSYIDLHLTFRNLVSYIKDGSTTILQMLHFIYLFSTNISTEYFKHAAHSPFFSSKCRFFS